MGDAQLLIDIEMQPASYRSFISSSTNDLYLGGIVYGLDATGKPAVGRSILLNWFYQNLLMSWILYM